MQITIHQSGDLSQNTQRVIREKIEKLETFYDRIERADVHIKSDDGSTPDSFTVQARLSVPGPDLSAEQSDQSIERAITDVAEALRRQIKKHKEKLQGHDHASKDLPPVGENDDAAAIYKSEEQL